MAKPPSQVAKNQAQKRHRKSPMYSVHLWRRREPFFSFFSFFFSREARVFLRRCPVPSRSQPSQHPAYAAGRGGPRLQPPSNKHLPARSASASETETDRRAHRINLFIFILFHFVLGTRLILRPIDFFVEFQFQVRRLRGALPGSALRSGSALACSPLCALWRPFWRPLWSCWPGISLYGAAGAARWLFWYYFPIIK